MTDLPKAFKRVNFFRGFLATEEDFNDATLYHVEKGRLHNRVFHVFCNMGMEHSFHFQARMGLSASRTAWALCRRANAPETP